MDTKLRLFEYHKAINRSIIYRNIPRVIKGNFDRKSDGRAIENKLPFGLDDMKLLVTAYNGYSQLLEELERIFEVRPTGGCFSDLDSIKMIQKLSPLYIDRIPLGEQELDRILDDISLSIDEVAEQLMGGLQ